MISYRGIGVSQRSYQDTSSEVGVTSVITPLPSGEGKGEGPLTNRGISVITSLSIRRGAGGEAFCECVCCKKKSNLERRKALVSLKRTPFLLVEDALLDPY